LFIGRYSLFKPVRFLKPDRFITGVTSKTTDAQIDIPAEKPYALSINMGGDDVSVLAIVYRYSLFKPVRFLKPDRFITGVTGKTCNAQIDIPSKKPYAPSINVGVMIV